MGPQPVVFLSDFGAEGAYAGMCRAVIARAGGDVVTLDLTHTVPRHDVRTGAIILARSLPYLPDGAVCLAVVDPGVGTDRRGLAVQAADGRLLVGPDNGLLWPALERCDGPAVAIDLARSPVRLEPVSPTFHGRDVFAPAAAHLATGADLREIGERVEEASLVKLDLPRAHLEDDCLRAHVLLIDDFGNVSLNARADDSAHLRLREGERAQIEVGGRTVEAAFAAAFAEVEPGALLLYVDSSGHLALARREGSAAEALGIDRDDGVTITAAGKA